jgi:hypothetical protein
MRQFLLFLAEIFRRVDFLDLPLERRLMACSNAIKRVV